MRFLKTWWQKFFGKKSGQQSFIEEAQQYKMTPEQEEAQRRSFAYGNAAIDNPHVTREMIDRAADQINGEINNIFPPSTETIN